MMTTPQTLLMMLRIFSLNLALKREITVEMPKNHKMEALAKPPMKKISD